MKKILLFLTMLVCSLATWATDAVTAKVSGTSLKIGLENSTSFVAFQMDIHGITVAASGAVEKTGRLATGDNVTIGGTSTATPFVVAYNTLTDGTVRVIAYNLGNHPITNASGDILNITLSAAPTQASDVTVDNILFVKETDLAEVNLDTVTGENGVLKGDVIPDGKFNINDVLAIIDISLGNTNPAYIVEAADLNNDGKYNINDVLAVIALSLGN